jgi:hypothetical protein
VGEAHRAGVVWGAHEEPRVGRREGRGRRFSIAGCACRVNRRSPSKSCTAAASRAGWQDLGKW